jgi:hypothetical protein
MSSWLTPSCVPDLFPKKGMHVRMYCVVFSFQYVEFICHRQKIDTVYMLLIWIYGCVHNKTKQFVYKNNSLDYMIQLYFRICNTSFHLLLACFKHNPLSAILFATFIRMQQNVHMVF